MPELPEVQTIVSDLNKVLPRLKIRDVWSDYKKMIKSPKTFPVFKKELAGREILNIERRGKNILINLSGNKTLLVHQKMTGHLLYGKFKKQKGKTPAWVATEKGPLTDDRQNGYLHMVINLSNGCSLALSDVRKFAKVMLWQTDTLPNTEDIKNVGPDPLEKDFTFKKFQERLSSRRGKVKDILMKQEIISGIGNIYSSEILWEAGIYPFKDISKLKEQELKKIYNASRKILKQGIKKRGDSIIDYRDAFGKKGAYQNFHKVYRREGEKCPRNDGGTIKRAVHAGRSAFYCPKCQPR